MLISYRVVPQDLNLRSRLVIQQPYNYTDPSKRLTPASSIYYIQRLEAVSSVDTGCDSPQKQRGSSLRLGRQSNSTAIANHPALSNNSYGSIIRSRLDVTSSQQRGSSLRLGKQPRSTAISSYPALSNNSYGSILRSRPGVTSP